MDKVSRWRKRNGLTQVGAASLLGVYQPYLSLLEKGTQPLTTELRNGIEATSGGLFRAQLSALGYLGFAHVAKSRTRPSPETLLMTVLRRPDADARVVEALPWLAATSEASSTSAGWCVNRSCRICRTG